MVASTDKAVNKTAFVTEVLRKVPTANRNAVNQAWTAAGHSGNISTTLVSKLRAELGLAGNLRATSKSRAKAKAAKTNGTHEVPVPVKKPRSSDRDRVLAEIEGDLDHLIFKLIAVGGFLDIENALRGVRRQVVRSHDA